MCDGDNGPASYRYVTVSGVVLAGPARLYAVWIDRAIAGGAVVIYDGVSVNGAPIIISHDSATLGLPAHFEFPGGVDLQFGLYVDMSGIAGAVTLVYRPLSGYGTART